MIAGVIGFVLHYIGAIELATRIIWGGLAVVGMVVTVMTRRPSD